VHNDIGLSYTLLISNTAWFLAQEEHFIHSACNKMIGYGGVTGILIAMVDDNFMGSFLTCYEHFRTSSSLVLHMFQSQNFDLFVLIIFLLPSSLFFVSSNLSKEDNDSEKYRPCFQVLLQGPRVLLLQTHTHIHTLCNYRPCENLYICCRMMDRHHLTINAIYHVLRE
jgi:hypothetical protein